MIDFTELPSDGNDFELLVRELLYAKGLEVYWSGKGADGGKDLLCIERHESCFKSSSQRWLIQCKHNAHSGRAVNKTDLDSIVDSCAEHNATGYLLVCSTFPSSNLVKRLEEIQTTKGIVTHFWDCRSLERELLKPANWGIANMFFPRSLASSGWNISAVESSFWQAVYQGNIMYIASRVSTNCNFFLDEIEKRIGHIHQLQLPEGHILRVRAMYFDDKYTNYVMYLDYLLPAAEEENNELLEYTVEELERYEIIDGISYRFDIMTYKYNPSSDSFDADSNGYYDCFLELFKNGLSREGQRRYAYADRKSPEYITEDFVNREYDALIRTMENVGFIKILKTVNARIEFIDQFTENFAWNKLISAARYDLNNVFDVQIRFVCDDFQKLTELLESIPQSGIKYYTLDRNFVFYPEEGLDQEDDDIYTLHITLHPGLAVSKYQYRKALNRYLYEITEALCAFLKRAE